MIIHDCFEGTMRCVQCKGPCKLTGQDEALTAFVRRTLEHFALQGEDGWIPDDLQRNLSTLLGVDEAHRFWQHARDSMASFRARNRR
jgi:hypothetical protein